ncbi:MAG: hypothetical protein AB7Y46_18720, partial [Armatimonadota bacterium]
GLTQGAFWHDINRAVTPGNLGPYSGREWALAGAAAFSTLRDAWKVYPLHAELVAPDTAPIANAFTVQVRLTNTANKAVRGVRIALCDTPYVVGVGLTQAPGGAGAASPQTPVNGAAAPANTAPGNTAPDAAAPANSALEGGEPPASARQGFGEPYTEVGTVPAGETVEVPLQVRITRADSARLNKMMLALRITWVEGNFAPPVRNELPRVIVLMKYITGR